MKKLVPLIILLGLVFTSVECRSAAAALTISPDTLPMAFVGKYYSVELTSNSMAPNYVKWSIMTGGVPSGLKFRAKVPVGSPATIEGTCQILGCP